MPIISNDRKNEMISKKMKLVHTMMIGKRMHECWFRIVNSKERGTSLNWSTPLLVFKKWKLYEQLRFVFEKVIFLYSCLILKIINMIFHIFVIEIYKLRNSLLKEMQMEQRFFVYLRTTSNLKGTKWIVIQPNGSHWIARGKCTDAKV